MSRRRRATIRGWSRYLPFVLVPFGLMFSEIWFQTQILNNEYEKNAIRVNIRQTEARIDELRDQTRELARMERVLERAPDLGLVPPEPGQVIEIGGDMAAAPPKTVQVTPILASPPTRRESPLAKVKSTPLDASPTLLLEEFDVLEPELEGLN